MRNARQIFIKWGTTPNAGKTYRFREAGNCKDLTPPIYTDVAYPFPANPPHVPTDYNPVGAYVREFTVPAHWKGMDIFLDLKELSPLFIAG